eukprot:2284144-Rhodomonas_salina.1
MAGSRVTKRSGLCCLGQKRTCGSSLALPSSSTSSCWEIRCQAGASQCSSPWTASLRCSCSAAWSKTSFRQQRAVRCRWHQSSPSLSLAQEEPGTSPRQEGSG